MRKATSLYSVSINRAEKRLDSRPLPWTYLRGFIGRILILVLLALLLVESIFIAEKLNEITLTVLDQNAPIAYIPLFIGLRMPDVFDLALPIAILIASYRVVLQARENREFQVFAGMGISVERLVLVAWLIGGASLVVSLTISGLVAPAAHYLQRYLLFEARYAVLGGAGPSEHFLSFDDYTVFVPANSTRTSVRPLYIHRRVHGTDETDSVIIADAGRLAGLHQTGPAFLHLQNPTIFNFTNTTSTNTEKAGRPIACPNCLRLPRSAVSQILHAQNLVRAVNLGVLNNFPPRGSTVDEASLFDLTFEAGSSITDRTRAIEFGRRLGRALLCLLAPLFAGAGLAVTSRFNQALIMPLAVGLLFAADVALSTLVEVAGSAGLLPAALAPTFLVAAAVIAMSLLARRAHASLIMPALARA